MRLSMILARIAARSGVAIWRHRLAWLLAVLAVGALGAYQLGYAGPGVVNGDCADTTMAAATKVDDDVSRAAYACLSPRMRNAPEDVFVAGMHERDMPRGHVSRVADQRTRDGGRIVFFTVEQQGQAVGYLIYLDQQGQVIRVE